MRDGGNRVRDRGNRVRDGSNRVRDRVIVCEMGISCARWVVTTNWNLSICSECSYNERLNHRDNCARDCFAYLIFNALPTFEL